MAILVSLVVFGATVYVLGANMRDFAVQLIADIPKLDDVIARLMGAMGLKTAPRLEHIFQTLNPSDYLMRIAGGQEKDIRILTNHPATKERAQWINAATHDINKGSLLDPKEWLAMQRVCTGS